MKKVTLILSALALVLGLSQCKKQEEPVQSGEKQHVVLTANNGNDGSKVAVGVSGNLLNLTWEGNETITVSGGASGTLTYESGAGTGQATFVGDITIDRGGDIVFTIGDAPSSYECQFGTADDCADWIMENNHFVGTSQWQDDGNYNVTMELQYAVLKLDVSALGTSGAMTIKVGETLKASVADVASSEGKAVFVAVPADETEKASYTITCNGKTATKTWTLEKNVFYTKAGAEGAGTGEAIVIELDAPATPKFTVDANGTTVEFAPGNLYYNGADDDNKMNSALPSGWNFYEHQWDYCTAATVGAINEISLFTWGYGSWSTDYTSYSYETGDKMTDWGEMVGDGWYTLSEDEWNYLLEERGKQRADANRFAKARVNGVNGLIIFPDNYNGTTSGPGIAGLNTFTSMAFPPKNIPDATWTFMESAGVVFLPAAGWRNKSLDVSFINTSRFSVGYYWSKTPSSNETSAKFLSFNASVSSNASNMRGWHRSVRLVRDVE